ncbi:MAG TPA: membrane protein insertion efficiency factor YidD [Bacillota bacterium]|nr:membrane protein insertion efficiency factor YidD [Bacillota bacterium]
MKNLLMFLIRTYKKHISPHLPASCRFFPSCSEYSLQAISKYGSAKGVALSVKRLIKCNPFNPGGYDPLN